jgi:hypothetical protein
MIDFSIFLTKENITFFVIAGIIFVIVIVILYIIVRFIVRLIADIYKRVFHKEKTKKDLGENIEVVVSQLEESKEERAKIAQQKVASATTGGPTLGNINNSKVQEKKEPEKPDQQTYTEKEQKDIAEGLERLKGTEEEGGGVMGDQRKGLGSKIKISTATVSGPKLDLSHRLEEKKEAGKPEKQIYTEKEQKDIAAGLGRLKGAEGSQPSFMDRQEDSVIDERKGLGSTIKIPVSKKIEENEAPVQPAGQTPVERVIPDSAVKMPTTAKVSKLDLNSRPKELEKNGIEKEEPVTISTNLHEQGLVYTEEQKEAAKKTLEKTQKNIEKKADGNAPSNEETLMFGGKEEVSRVQLRQKLRSSKIFNAERQVGLTLSPVERSKLEKEVFSQSLGGSISKTDLKWGVHKLNQKYLSEKDPEQKAKLRKEIKFFKKIGGIK